MTRQRFEILLERISNWPEEAQDEFVRSIADIEERHLGPHRLSDDERNAVRRGLSEMREAGLRAIKQSLRYLIAIADAGALVARLR